MGLGGHLGGRLGGHFHGLQKRNVLIRWTFRWTLLTLLTGDLLGKRYKKNEKTVLLAVFKGLNTLKIPFSMGGFYAKVPKYRHLRESR